MPEDGQDEYDELSWGPVRLTEVLSDNHERVVPSCRGQSRRGWLIAAKSPGCCRRVPESLRKATWLPLHDEMSAETSADFWRKTERHNGVRDQQRKEEADE